jgi:hypothetical protein
MKAPLEVSGLFHQATPAFAATEPLGDRLPEGRSLVGARFTLVTSQLVV